MDINEIAKKMTREEFIEQQSQQVYKPSCPHRFKLTDYFPKCSVKVFDCEECWENAVKGIKFKDDIEGDKMEDKTIKVRCIDNIRGSMYLTIGKEYEAREYDKERYSVINDREVESVYSKSKFEKITADILIVECINNSNQKRELTINKKYPVIKVKSKGYLIKNNIGNIEEYNLWRFKPAGPQKEVSTEENICYQKEYSGNKENKCIVKGSTCITRLKEPANIKEEYQRLKEENKKLKETLQDKNNYIHDLQVSHNKIEQENIKLKEKLDRANTESVEYYLKWSDSETKIKKLQGESNAFEKMSDLYREKQKVMESDLIKYESIIKDLKETLKNIVKVL